jgi:hypothetical protein
MLVSGHDFSRAVEVGTENPGPWPFSLWEDTRTLLSVILGQAFCADTPSQGVKQAAEKLW